MPEPIADCDLNKGIDTLVIITGGTIDAHAYPDPRHPPHQAEMLAESAIPKALETLGLADRCAVVSWLRRDSKDFGQQNLRALAGMIREHACPNIIITHGTDRMVENAGALKKLLARTDKRVAVTGAMLPLANGAVSDGWDNLRFAFDVLHAEPRMKPGVSIAFAGELFDPEKARKNFEEKRFEHVHEALVSR